MSDSAIFPVEAASFPGASANSADLPVMGIKVAGGVTVAVPPRIDLLTPYVLLEQEDWFEDEIGFLRRRLGAGARVVDIGANYGLYSLALAKVAGASGRVWSVEPASQTSAYLRMSAEINEFGWLGVIQKALSNKAGTARLSVEANSELNSLSQGTAGGATEEVQLATLDALASEHGWTGIDFLKLDAEGEEERIIEGAARFLRDEDPLVMFEIRHGDRLNLHLVERLAAAGYGAYLLVPGLDVLVPFDASNPVDHFRLNLFACKASRAKLLEAQGALVRELHGARTPEAIRYAQLLATYDETTAEARIDARALGSRARIASELGMRDKAVRLLNEALKACLEGNVGDTKAPPTAPVAAFDSIAPQGRPAEWLMAALLDGLVELTRFSTYFTRGNDMQQPTLDRLEALKATGFQRPPMERRRQLLRILAGLQQGPQADPSVTNLAPDNLNPGLWGG